MLGWFNPKLGQMWTNPNVGLKMSFKKVQLKVKVEVSQILNYIFNPTFGLVHI